ncbi:MAG TPA: PAS domain-containing protein [Bacteroidetes bacterium]|nr:PAS domain-containing protein [Bacteroidota bacterium]
MKRAVEAEDSPLEKNLLDSNDFLNSLFDAIPSYLFIVDEDVRILGRNSAAARLLGNDGATLHMKRGGDVLHCIHSMETPEGCGHAPYCSQCVIRNGVNAACRGEAIQRKSYRMILRKGGRESEMYMLITTAPLVYEGETYVLLCIEDISEVIQLKSLLPICAHCKKIRNDDEYWESVEEYISTRIDVDFSHGICPDCMEKYYSDIFNDDPVA